MILALGLIVAIHELGHFVMARFFKVGIEKFSIGFGPPIVEFERAGVNYRISWIPLGGYLKMKGENPDEQDDEAADDSYFNRKSWWQRALIVFAGPFANLLLGILLFTFAFFLPQKLQDSPAVIHSAEGLWAEHFAPGDSLMELNGMPINGFNSFLIKLVESNENEITYKRGEEILSFSFDAALNDSLLSSIKPYASTKIGDVLSGMPAWRAGLKEGDVVLEVDSVKVNDWYEMRRRIVDSEEDKVSLLISREGKEILRHIPLEKNVSTGDQKMIGISQYFPIQEKISYSFKEAMLLGPYSALNFIVMNYKGLYMLTQRPEQFKNSVGGPVMIASMSSEMSRRGFSSLILFFGSISLILMVMNLLPIPILDGGHIFFAILEGIFRRPIPKKVQEYAQRLGFLVLVFLMLFAFYADITKLLYRFIYMR